MRKKTNWSISDDFWGLKKKKAHSFRNHFSQDKNCYLHRIVRRRPRLWGVKRSPFVQKPFRSGQKTATSIVSRVVDRDFGGLKEAHSFRNHFSQDRNCYLHRIVRHRPRFLSETTSLLEELFYIPNPARNPNPHPYMGVYTN